MICLEALSIAAMLHPMRITSLFMVLACQMAHTVLAAEPAAPGGKPELFLMLPEPRAMGSDTSKNHAGSKTTVFTPARENDNGHGIRPYTAAEFAKLGISWETFLERAQATADKRLAAMQPEWKKDEAGQVLYAVFHSDDPGMAAILLAPSLAHIFKKVFPDGVWLAAPNRNTLYVFPAKPELVESFAENLKAMFDENPFAASDEIFALKDGGDPLRVVASFKGH